jgi:hypothetical protein
MGMNRNQKVEFNFDSLTDCITNLAGSLILVTLIIFGMTKAKESGAVDPHYKDRKVGGDASIAAVVHTLDVMRNDVQAIRRNLDSMAEQLPQMAADLEKIEKRSKSR